MENSPQNMIFGINPLLEALKSDKCRILKIYVSSRKQSNRIEEIIDRAKKRKIKYKRVDLKTFQELCPWENNQGVAATISKKTLLSIEELINISLQKEPNPALVILDHIEDPRNLGSIVRSAEVLGICGIIIPKDRAADLTPVVSKTSAGALENMPVCRVSNIQNAVRLLKEKGFWIVGAKQGSKDHCFTYDFKRPVALVLGGESKGFRPVIEKNCDSIISIPQTGKTNSLNVSNAASILFYEILKQKM